MTASSLFARLIVAIAFSIAFAYIESAVVVYLRAIFYPEGFNFPITMFDLTELGKRLTITEIGREAATLVLILTSAWLFGRNRQERTAYFLLIFGIWDIFYYVWLKVLLGWPTSIMDWDVLFLIPIVWAAPVLYPIIVSLVMIAMAVGALTRSERNHFFRVTWIDWLGWTIASVILIVSFCLGGRGITEPDYRAYFPPWLFFLGFAFGIVFCIRTLVRPTQEHRIKPDKILPSEVA